LINRHPYWPGTWATARAGGQLTAVSDIMLLIFCRRFAGFAGQEFGKVAYEGADFV
jgi:hypothetical protein